MGDSCLAQSQVSTTLCHAYRRYSEDCKPHDDLRIQTWPLVQPTTVRWISLVRASACRVMWEAENVRDRTVILWESFDRRLEVFSFVLEVSGQVCLRCPGRERSFSFRSRLRIEIRGKRPRIEFLERHQRAMGEECVVPICREGNVNTISSPRQHIPFREV